ncbi:choice-of-anchor L domain-containing protein [Flavobacterium sp. RHBU_3]|uniref:choice-of-anchor L domain-containing protein n=1 Tax=Flavobacterium sp. RHBU_3 TaxID=3391184 RepID=UPI003984E910
MKIKILHFTLIIIISAGFSASAQNVVVDNTYTAQQLVDVLTANSCAQISNISVKGAPGSSPSYGYFNAGTSSFPFNAGIVLSSGFASSVPGPNNQNLSDTTNNWDGDNDLENALNTNNTQNATVLEFDFVPITNNISFDYIFASEEYIENPPTPAWCNFSDGFAFLIKPAGSAQPYQNLAVVPGTTTPVKVTSVRGQGGCTAANEEYFNGYNGFTSPTDFNGQTVILTASTTVVAGTTYHIKLVIADQGDTQFDSAIFLGAGTFAATIDLGADRLLANDNPLCNGESLQLDATTPNAVAYQWYKDGDILTGETSAFLTVTTPGRYSAEIQLTGTCTAHGEITLEYAAPISTAPYTYYQCDENNDGLTAYYLPQVSEQIAENNTGISVVSYHSSLADANADINSIPASNDTPFYNTVADETIYARVRNEYSCIVSMPVVLSVPVFATLPVTPIGLCDDDGTDDGYTAFSLDSISASILTGYPTGTTLSFFTTETEAIANISPLGSSFINTTKNTQTLYARLGNAQGCAATIQVPLIVYSFGNAILPESVILCDSHPLTLDAGTGYVSYTWDTLPVQTGQTLTVTTPGDYTVTFVNTQGCQGSKTFTVEQSGAAADVTYEVNDFRGSHNSLIVTAGGYGTYEYSLDGVNWQDSNVFDELETGHYTFYVRDINGCSPVYSKSLYILDYPKYFTPNADGTQDTWRIRYLTTRPGVSVNIFDRFGKLITNIGYRSEGWDGTLNGKPLPATDYWFVINLENGDNVKGHFALIR